jgi:flagellar hook protein FlgE
MVMDAIYTGLSGMQAYSTGLDVISNNVANLNTVGFKSSTPVFQDLVFQSASASLNGEPENTSSGAGVEAHTLTQSFAQGQLSATGAPLDAAIDGNGFFVLNDNGTTLYTRAGQFEIDKKGDVVDTTTQAQVMFSTPTTTLGPLNVNASQTDPPVATTTVTLAGNLVQNTTTPTTFTTPAITVFDSSGGSETLTVHFAQNATNPLQWTAQVEDANSNVIGSQTLTFNADGTPATGSTSITAAVTPTSAPKFNVAFNLGAAGTFAGITSTASGTTSTVQAANVDGQALGTLTQYAFTNSGQLQITYSNGDTKTIGTLVLARFQTQDQLKEVSNGAFVAAGGATPTLGAPLDQGLGSIDGGNLEMSNVDLTTQFTDLITIERGYQAGSQMVSTAGDMMQQLLDMERGR